MNAFFISKLQFDNFPIIIFSPQPVYNLYLDKDDNSTFCRISLHESRMRFGKSIDIDCNECNQFSVLTFQFVLRLAALLNVGLLPLKFYNFLTSKVVGSKPKTAQIYSLQNMSPPSTVLMLWHRYAVWFGKPGQLIMLEEF